MKELSRIELATCKRTAASVKTWRNQLAKKVAKYEELGAEIESLQRTIDKFEAPIVELTGGFTSEDVLNGTMDLAISKEKELMATESINQDTQEVNTNEEPTVVEVNLDEIFDTTNDEPLPFEV